MRCVFVLQNVRANTEDIWNCVPGIVYRYRITWYSFCNEGNSLIILKRNHLYTPRHDSTFRDNDVVLYSPTVLFLQVIIRYNTIFTSGDQVINMWEIASCTCTVGGNNRTRPLSSTRDTPIHIFFMFVNFLFVSATVSLSILRGKVRFK